MRRIRRTPMPSIHASTWTCPIPGCRKCGAGYGSESQAAAARRRHVETHPIAQRPGVAR